jgi:hypothetical protein
MRPEKPRSRVTALAWHDKDPSLLKGPEPHEQFFSYLAVVIITGDRAGNSYANHLWLLAVRVLLRATPAATRDLGLYGLIRMTGTHVPQWDSNPQRKDHQIFTPPL